MTIDVASIRLFVSDIDGTLVRHDKSLANATIDAFHRLTAAGTSATLISARPPSGIAALAAKLGLNGPLAAFNGGTIFMSDGTIRVAHHLEHSVVVAALELLDHPGVETWLFADGLWFAPNADNPRVPRERLSAGVEPTLRASFWTLTDRVDKIVGVSEDAAMLFKLEQRALQTIGNRATVALSQPYFLDFTAPLANKGDGLVALAEAYDAALSQVLVIGDMANDLPMFARAGMSIAMGQAPERVQQAADYISTSNEDDGVAAAINGIILGGRRPE